mmetsp:Transcript_18093/g.27372  ORF Transcript_18093/g.27372 Transcript_18093/m.27372 type:complete len:592 (+) Transcript_18093:27-1802(+)
MGSSDLLTKKQLPTMTSSSIISQELGNTESRGRFSGLLETSSVDFIGISPDSPSGGIVSTDEPIFDGCNSEFGQELHNEYSEDIMNSVPNLNAIDRQKTSDNNTLTPSPSQRDEQVFRTPEKGEIFKSSGKTDCPQSETKDCQSTNQAIESNSLEDNGHYPKDTAYHNEKQPTSHVEGSPLDFTDQSQDINNITNTPLQSKSLNTSIGSPYNINIDSARKKIGASSHAFMEQLRGAANRRKDQVIRSRDSLVAKQNDIKETTKKAIDAVVETKESLDLQIKKEISTMKHFRALPLTSTSSRGGMIGIRKVEKKKSTVPVSPLLGARRSGKEMKDISEKVVDSIAKTQESLGLQMQFRALQMPSTSSRGGMVGIRKVEKKKSTMPVSPLLGARRPGKAAITALQKQSKIKLKKGKDMVEKFRIDFSISKKIKSEIPALPFRAKPAPQGFSVKSGTIGISKVSKRPVTVAISPPLGVRRPVSRCVDQDSAPNFEASSLSLLGLNLLSPSITTDTSSNLENLNPGDLNTPTSRRVTGYIPQSTKRAQKRAGFDQQRIENEQKRLEQMTKERDREIKLKRNEISNLRPSLSQVLK